jgi:hypothetical protein
LKCAAELEIAQQDDGADRHHREREKERVQPRHHFREISAEGDGCDRDRGGKPHRCRDPPGKKSERRMVDHPKKMIFAARPRQGRTQLRIRKRAAERANSARDPDGHDGETGRHAGHLKSETGENAGAHHVGDDNAGGREGRNCMHLPRARTHAAMM